MPTTTASSNVLRFPARSPSRIDSVRRFGRPRYSSLYLLGARLFNRAIAVPITTVTRLVVDVRSHLAGRQLRRSSRELLRALDNLIVLNARAYRDNLDVLRKRSRPADGTGRSQRPTSRTTAHRGVEHHDILNCGRIRCLESGIETV